MSYNPSTDFIGLLRLVGSGVRSERMPGLDYVVAALAPAGVLNLSVGRAEPPTSQVNTAWLRTAIPSWTAEGTLWLWSSVSGSYQPATPALWIALLAAGASTGPSRIVTISGAFVMGTADA